ncbi:MAG: tRNA pseudouridine(55) synthase TruB [Acutalibacteraceae bacterium]|jgi:tRNA pseudouridine55 synthase
MTGLLLLDKPQGITSFSAVSAVKRLTNEKRVGHTGTLDPMATGVLPVLIGRATAISGLILDGDKKYIAEIKLGITTDTDDITGKILSDSAVNVDNEKLLEVLNRFVGKISQTPPMYSAIKKDGVRLYKLAREGRTVELTPRNVEIFGIRLLSSLNDEGVFKIETHVSKGTYIRSLARDIGRELGCGATLLSLRRTYAAGFSISDCVELAKLDNINISGYILSEEAALLHLREIKITKNQAVRFCNGGRLSYDRLSLPNGRVEDGELFRVKSDNLLLGIGFADNTNMHIGIKCIINYPEGHNR